MSADRANPSPSQANVPTMECHNFTIMSIEACSTTLAQTVQYTPQTDIRYPSDSDEQVLTAISDGMATYVGCQREADDFHRQWNKLLSAHSYTQANTYHSDFYEYAVERYLESTYDIIRPRQADSRTFIHSKQREGIQPAFIVNFPRKRDPAHYASYMESLHKDAQRRSESSGGDDIVRTYELISNFADGQDVIRTFWAYEKARVDSAQMSR